MMEMTSTAAKPLPGTTKKPGAAKALFPRADIQKQLRDIKAAGFGRPVAAFGRKITAARRYRKGISGQWDPAYVLAIGPRKGRPADAIVLMLDDAVEYLFGELNGVAK